MDRIVDSFTLSLYNNAGFSYVVKSGDVLIRSPHPNSNKTVQNLFDMLRRPKTAVSSWTSLPKVSSKFLYGWATFNYQGEATVFCYTPLKPI